MHGRACCGAAVAVAVGGYAGLDDLGGFPSAAGGCARIIVWVIFWNWARSLG